MQSPPVSEAEIAARISSHFDELLELWWAEQGASKPKDLQLIASAIPFPRNQAIHALDLCCGPGDVGRAISQMFPMAQVDFIDRDPFLTSICRAINQRDRIPGKVVVRDLYDDDWLGELSGKYDVVATVNALHWFDAQHATRLVKDVHGALGAGGIFLLAEPACFEPPLAAGVEEWKASQPPRYTRENWERFWSRANAILGYDHTALLRSGPVSRIGDGMSVTGWRRVLETADFALVDVLLRDVEQVILGAVKSR
jgi:SAM-dependent methyltransferase